MAVKPAARTKAQARAKSKSTQESLLISEIRDGIVIMHDGSMRAVVMGSAINFDLMSPEERDSVEYAYQNFLNSLHFTIQIVIKSQKIDLDPYLDKLGRLRHDQDNELLGTLMDDYIANIRSLVEEVNIMDKQFFVVIPYYPPAMRKIKRGNVFTAMAEAFKPPTVTTVNEADFTQFKEELSQRVQLVISNLGQMGIRSIPLNTQELIDLFYSSYNPDVAQTQKLIDAGQIQTAAVTKGEGQAPPPPLMGGPF